jgi:serine protease Do
MYFLSLRLSKFVVLIVVATILQGGVALAKAVTPDFVDLAKKLKPTVVNISTAKTITPQKRLRHPPTAPFGSDPFEDFFERFFNEAPQRSFKEKSLGSGFIISNEGYILTNNHVVAGADEIRVKLSDGREFKGEVTGNDEKLDIALIKIDAKDHLPVAQLGDSDAIDVGEWVMAIGNPFGLGQTVTAGIVSATGRVIGSGPYDDFIQTDASINPGNSGGPLFNARGEVIGINAAIVAGGQGIGFAIPINMAKVVVPQLEAAGKVTRGWLGVAIQPITPDLAKAFGLKTVQGALVAEVTKGSPAEKGGLQSGDIITVFNGKDIHEMNELPRLVAATTVGKTVTVSILRKGSIEQKTVTIQKLEESGSTLPVSKVEERLGMAVRDINEELAARLRLKVSGGVVVIQIAPGSSAEEAGILAGDIIREVNGLPVKNLLDYQKAMTAATKGTLMRLLLKRGDSSLFVALPVE